MKLKTALFTAACVLNVTASNARVNTEPASRPSSSASADPVTGFGQCRQFFPGELPRVPYLQERKPRDLCFDAFAVLHSGRSKTPIFAVEQLTAAQLQDAAGEERTNRFFADARLPSAERATLADYEDSGLERGHIAAAADMPTSQAMAQSFSLSNMVPQAPEIGHGVWAAIEETTRQYVQRANGPIYVFTGPVYGKDTRVIGKGRVWVPTQLFKLVYDPMANRAWAYWIENDNDARAGTPISYAELVRRTGIEFLPGVALASQETADGPNISQRINPNDASNSSPEWLRDVIAAVIVLALGIVALLAAMRIWRVLRPLLSYLLRRQLPDNVHSAARAAGRVTAKFERTRRSLAESFKSGRDSG